MKNKTTKRILFGVLALIMIVTSLPLAGVASFAYPYYTSGDWEYELSGGNAILRIYLGNSKTVSVPSTIDGHTVTTLCQTFLFSDVEKVILPATLTDIGDEYAFYDSSVKHIEVNSNNKVYSSANGVLFNKSKTELIVYPCCKEGTSYTVPASVTTIGDYAFQYCGNLKKLILQKNVKSIGKFAFFDCSIENLTIMNPNAIIDEYCRFGSMNSFNDGDKVEYVNKNAIIFGYKGSTAEKYANNEGILFCEIGEFPDVAKGSWYYDAVKYVSKKGYITGYQNGRFGPSENIRRQDFVSILARIAGADLSQYQNVKPKLSDVKQGSYYAAAVNWAVDEGIIAGYQNGKFGVGDPITREQVAAIFYRYMGEPYVSGADSVLAKFRDRSKISPYAKTAVAWAVQNNIISGMSDGRIAAKEGASRAQIAVIIQKMDQKGMF